MEEDRWRQPIEGEVIVVAELVNSTSQTSTTSSATVRILVVSLTLIIAGVVGGVASTLRGNDGAVPRTSSVPVTPVNDPLLKKLISSIAFSDHDLALFSDPTSPQYQALVWLRNDTITMSQDRSVRDVVQRYALSLLYFATSGPDWSWSYLSSRDVCSWNNGTDVRHGVYCLHDGDSVDALILDDNNLQGQLLPWELVLLTNLEVINLSSNQLSGFIPTRIFELTLLQTLDGSSNSLRGSLPATFASTMVEINLSFNDFVGRIPEAWGTSMPGLQYLDLRGNSLTGPLPTTLGLLSSLERLIISENQLTGTLPSELGHMLSLKWLEMSSNKLLGTIPSELGHMLSLENCTINFNQLIGTIPSEMGQLQSLNWLAMTDNMLSGNIPSELTGIGSLQFLDLHSNDLTGTLPTTLGQLSLLDELHVSFNKLTGTIPTELGQLRVLTWFGMSDNMLSGTIPSELSGIDSLERFDFFKNSLTGSVDEFFCVGNRTWTSLSADCDKVDCQCCTRCF